MPRRTSFLVVLSFLLLVAIGLAVWLLTRPPVPSSFDGQRAYQDMIAQVALGPRTVGSEAHAQTIKYIQAQLRKAHWRSQIQATSWNGFPIENILATRGDQTPQIILGAHYDSRMVADQDPGTGPHPPVPGANDGASGVAVLLELARSLPRNTVPISLVFIDNEDNG